MQKDSLTIDDIKQAQERISPYINRTKLIRAESMQSILKAGDASKNRGFQIERRP